MRFLSSLNDKLNANKDFICGNKFSLYLLVVGLLLRLKHYFDNRSLWLDEAWVALDISARPLNDILNNISIFPLPLAAPPIGFSAIVKVLVLLFGNNEYILRLWPLFCGSLSLLVFYFFVKRYANPKISPICLGLFVFSEPLIYYSSELKHYSSDVLSTCILYVIIDYCHRKNYEGKGILFLGLVGAVMMWFTYSSFFVLAGIGIVLFVNICKKKYWNKLPIFAFICFFWCWSFIVLFQVSISQMIGSKELIGMWSNSFMPTNQGIGGGLIWLKNSLLNAFSSTLGLSAVVLAFCVFLLGCFSLVKENKSKLFYLILPMLIALAMGMLNKYPFSGRLILFLSPCLAIIIGEGLVFISERLPKYSSMISVLLIAVLFTSPIGMAYHNSVHKRSKEEIRSVMNYLKRHFQKGDFIYLNNSSQYAYGYYHGYLNFQNESILVGKIEDWSNNEEFCDIGIEYQYHLYTQKGFLVRVRKMKKEEVRFKNGLNGFLKNKRTWFIFSHANIRQEEKIIEYLNQNGNRINYHQSIGASIYLYDLS